MHPAKRPLILIPLAGVGIVLSLLLGTTNVNRSQVEAAIGGGSGSAAARAVLGAALVPDPGQRLKLHPDDLYALGAHRGGINERWFSSTTNAANGPARRHDEGLSYVDRRRRGFLLEGGGRARGDLLLGAAVMQRDGGWNLLCKFFDNMGPIPHHMHQSDEQAQLRRARRASRRRTTFRRSTTRSTTISRTRSWASSPGRRKADVRKCLENWNEGDNGILYLSRAYRLKPGTGWQIDAGILHAPGSLVHL